MINDIFQLFGERTDDILFEIITECMDDYLYIFDLQNNIFEISQSAVKRFNMSKNVLTDAANEVMKVVYEEDRRMLAKHLADICEGRENVHNLHYRWLDKEGMPVWINCRGIVIIDQQGKAEYLVGMRPATREEPIMSQDCLAVRNSLLTCVHKKNPLPRDFLCI